MHKFIRCHNNNGTRKCLTLSQSCWEVQISLNLQLYVLLCMLHVHVHMYSYMYIICTILLYVHYMCLYVICTAICTTTHLNPKVYSTQEKSYPANMQEPQDCNDDELKDM